MTKDAPEEKRKRGQRIWTDAQRAEASARTKAQAPWRKTTGPKTEAGKRASSRNALKHGMRSATVAEFKRFLRFNRYIVELRKRDEKRFSQGPVNTSSLLNILSRGNCGSCVGRVNKLKER